MPTPAPTQANPLRVLYVEDNRVNAILMQEALRPHPHLEITVVEDARSAIKWAHEYQADVLVLDAHLPDMDGLALLKALRALPGVATTPAFMCSADAMPEEIQKAKSAGFEGYWTKPIDIRVIVRELSRLAQMKQT